MQVGVRRWLMFEDRWAEVCDSFRIAFVLHCMFCLVFLLALQFFALQCFSVAVFFRIAVFFALQFFLHCSFFCVAVFLRCLDLLSFVGNGFGRGYGGLMDQM